MADDRNATVLCELRGPTVPEKEGETIPPRPAMIREPIITAKPDTRREENHALPCPRALVWVLATSEVSDHIHAFACDVDAAAFGDELGREGIEYLFFDTASDWTWYGRANIDSGPSMLYRTGYQWSAFGSDRVESAQRNYCERSASVRFKQPGFVWTFHPASSDE